MAEGFERIGRGPSDRVPLADPGPVDDDTALMRSVLARVATGPELGRSISREEAAAAMAAVLGGRVHQVQAALFLIALRMKRETDDENHGLLDAMLAASARQPVDVDLLVDVADPYDGFDRCLPASPFLPALLAACGMPSYSHGVLDVGPKHGITTRQVLEAAGVDCSPDLPEAARRLGDPGCGWVYLDQARFAPDLHALLPLRELMVKRPAITTLEKLLHPLRGRGVNALLIGFVHKAYPRVYALMARQAGFDSALLVRGVEGGVIPSLRQPAMLHGFVAGGADEAVELDPTAFGIESDQRAPALPASDASVRSPELVDAALGAGLGALEGRPGATREALVYAASICLWRLGRARTPVDAAAAVRRVLDSGAPRDRFDRVCLGERGMAP